MHWPASVRGVCLDAAGTLLQPTKPVWRTYADAARGQGWEIEETQVRARLGPAMRRHRDLRARDRGWEAYWRAVVRAATGIAEERIFTELYRYYDQPGAWSVADGAVETLTALRERGYALALISNWDVRLVGLLTRLQLTQLFDAVLVSAVEGMEKPDPAIYGRACQRLGLKPAQVLHVGDDAHDDVAGARAAGLHALHFGTDIQGLWDLALRAPLVR